MVWKLFQEGQHCYSLSGWIWCSVDSWKDDLVVMSSLIINSSKDVFSLINNFLTWCCACRLLLFHHISIFLALDKHFITLYIKFSFYRLMLRFISMLSPCFSDKQISMLLSWMWCMSMSNFGSRDCMLMSAILSPAEFQMFYVIFLVATIGGGEFHYFCS